jgi:Pentapeptide repeats (9 copies)
MPSSPTTEAPAAVAFVCDCDEWARSACNGLLFYKKHEGKRYCVLHYPGKDKAAAFHEALERKHDAQDFNFRGVWFPEAVDFSEFTFTSPASFRSATFSAAVSFRSATFSAEVSFGYATFSAEAYFGSATFSAEAYFRYATFSAEAYFGYATFSATASFDSATFSAEAYFRYTSFKDYVRFAGNREIKVFDDNSSLNFQFAKIEKPDHFSFHTVMLRPHWFVNVDARKFEFIDVNWNWQSISTKQEIKSIDEGDILSKHRLLAIACRNLAVNAEENNRYEDASRLRYMAMDARRLERWRGFAFWTLGWWYWLASGYGERVWRAFVVLIGVWLVAAALYTRVGFARWEPRVSTEREAAEARRDEVGESLRWPRALTYSLGVMTLQKPEPRPATNAAQSLVMLETILGPVQAALLALAIRRKFMR